VGVSAGRPDRAGGEGVGGDCLGHRPVVLRRLTRAAVGVRRLDAAGRCVVLASGKVRASDFLSQAHAAAARLGSDANHYQTLFGPTTARKTAIEIHLAFGDVGQALGLISDTRMPDSTPVAVRCRHMLNVSLAYCEAKRWDEPADTLLEVCTTAPEWVRHQALAGVVVQRIGDGSTAKLRKVSQVLGLPLIPR
jgi:hypothetical protein